METECIGVGNETVKAKSEVKIKMEIKWEFESEYEI